MRLLVISNRLPITVEEKKGKLLFQESVGGLVSGISAYLDSMKGSPFTKSEYIWIGWPGITVSKGKEEELKSRALEEYHAYPVFIAEETMENFYHGFCNKTIWPLFHYLPSYATFEDYWDCYKEVNELFCDAITDIIKPDDLVWIHDYHLMLLPSLLRKKMPDIPIGFFLHIPFPSFEIFRLLPRIWSREILEGLLGADLIGFHTYDYTQYFLRCVLRMLGYEHNMGKLILEGHNVRVDTFPMGIDFHKYHNAAKSDNVKSRKNDLIKKVGPNRKIIMSADRLDYTKGILNRLKAFEAFLEKKPQYYEKVIFILLVVPSRIGVENYQEMKKQIDEYVGKINGKFGSISWTPIIYLYKFESLYPLVALYSISDIALITPLRDGMNLVAKEYISSRIDRTGVLILSEMAGAAKELGEAILINPNSLEEMSDVLEKAIEMPLEDQIRRNTIMQTRLQRYDVVRWADDFIQKLILSKGEFDRFKTRLLSREVWDQIVRDFKNAPKRLVLLDYDGTLVPFADRPELAKPDETILKLLSSLQKNPKNDIVIVSGRDKNNLDNWFGEMGIGLVAEHGAWIKEYHTDWILIEKSKAGWKPHVYKILETYADRLPKAFIEEKEFSLVWHYRMSDPEQSSVRAKELLDDLVNFTANINVQIIQGNKAIEIRNAGINKGIGAMQFITKKDFDFMLAIGDDWTDEDLFKVLPERAYTIKVGMTWSYAKFNLQNYMQVQKLIQDMIQ